MADQGISQRRGAETNTTGLSQVSNVTPRSDTGESYFVGSLINFSTADFSSKSSREATQITFIGPNTEVTNAKGSSYSTRAISQTGVRVPVATRNFLACYDTNQNRHEWVDYNVSLEKAPTLVGATYVVSTLTILGKF